ncbi:MAG: thioredoxin family protein [Candidatus Omnitrophica bacterium]|nr:thioredoxin family protein [Candidatus Omnitrophota bacterium]
MKYFISYVIVLILALLFSCGVCYADNCVDIGISEEEVMELMGEPLGRAVSDNTTILQYSSFRIILKDDKVVESLENKVKEPAAIIVEQKSTKIELNIPVIKKTTSTYEPLKKKVKKYKKIRTINEKGKSVKLDSLLVPGKVTIIDFYADWCGPCKKISPKLEKFVCKYKDVYLRKVNIVNWKTPVIKQFKIESVPHVRVYDRDGNIVGEPTSSYKNVEWYVEKIIK